MPPAWLVSPCCTGCPWLHFPNTTIPGANLYCTTHAPLAPFLALFPSLSARWPPQPTLHCPFNLHTSMTQALMVLVETAPVQVAPYSPALAALLLAEMGGRLWDGKEALATALGGLCTGCTRVLAQAPGGVSAQGIAHKGPRVKMHNCGDECARMWAGNASPGCYIAPTCSHPHA